MIVSDLDKSVLSMDHGSKFRLELRTMCENNVDLFRGCNVSAAGAAVLPRVSDGTEPQ